MTKPAKKKSSSEKRVPRIEMAVADSLTWRKAQTNAYRSVWGAKQGEYAGRDVRLEMEIATAEGTVTADTEAFFECSVDTWDFAGRVGPGESNRETHEIRINDAQLGDVPLLILALQEVLRVGVAQGSFPAIAGIGAERGIAPDVDVDREARTVAVKLPDVEREGRNVGVSVFISSYANDSQAGTVFLDIELGTTAGDGSEYSTELDGHIKPEQIDKLIYCLTLARQEAEKLGLLSPAPADTEDARATA